MRSFAVVLLLAALGATGSPQTVTVGPSNIGFADALAACPDGTLGSISLSQGHVRVHQAMGVDTDIDDANVNAQTITFSKGSKGAAATVDAAKNTVTAKHVTLASRRRVACVAPD